MTNFQLGGLFFSLQPSPVIVSALESLYRRMARRGCYPRLEVQFQAFNRLQTEMRLCAKLTIQVAPFTESSYLIPLDSLELASPLLTSIERVVLRLEQLPDPSRPSGA